MSYSNWGATVYRNGVRVKTREDAVPFAAEDDNPWVIKYINAMRNHDPNKPWNSMHHAVLGDRKFRLCGYKVYPVIYVASESNYRNYVSLEPERREISVSLDYSWERTGIDYIGDDEYIWTARGYNDGQRMDLTLIEPDGTLWTATTGYQYGSGFED